MIDRNVHIIIILWKILWKEQLASTSTVCNGTDLFITFINHYFLSGDKYNAETYSVLSSIKECSCKKHLPM